MNGRTGQDRKGNITQKTNGQNRTGQNRTRQGRTGQGRRGQDKTGQNRTSKNRTGKTGQEASYITRPGITGHYMTSRDMA